jgi:hypothetical protein
MRIPQRESPGYRCSPIMSNYNGTVELQTIKEESEVSTEVFGRVRRWIRRLVLYSSSTHNSSQWIRVNTHTLSIAQHMGYNHSVASLRPCRDLVIPSIPTVAYLNGAKVQFFGSYVPLVWESMKAEESTSWLALFWRLVDIAIGLSGDNNKLLSHCD